MKRLFYLVVLFALFVLGGAATVNAANGVAIPFDDVEVSALSYVDVAKQLVKAGFTNVTTDEIYDLDPDNKSTYTDISINGYSAFKKSDIIPADAKITVVGHYPFEQYTVSIAIDFEENWIFDKYGITLSLDGESPISLKHGQSGTFEFEVPAGTYQLSFVHEKKSDISQAVKLEVSSDIHADYHIRCRSDKIELTENGIKYSNQLKENEIKATLSHEYFLAKHYTDCVKILEKMGFTNISTQTVTDANWDYTTPAGQVTSVSIGNKKNFSYGDRFSKDAKVIVSYHVPTVTFSKETITITEDDSFELTHTLSKWDRPEDIEIKILDTKLVKQGKNNQFIAIDPGETKIAAYYKDICLAECTVIVELRIIPISSITLPESEKTVSVGEVFKLEYTIEPLDANYTELQYQLSNDWLEIIDSGTFYSTVAGDTEITILQDERVLGSMIIHAEDVHVEGISFDDEEITVGVGRSIEVPFVLQPENATTITLDASLSNAKIAELTFNKKGGQVISITGKAPGKTTITIKGENKLSAKKDIIVTEVLPESIAITTETETPFIGTTGVFTATFSPLDVTSQKLTWKSNAPKVVKVNKDGSYQALSVGEAIITATHAKGVEGTIQIKVLPIEVETITLSSKWDESKPFYKNDSMTLTAEIQPENATDKTITWTSSDESVATVSTKGVVKAVSHGTATIIAQASNGKQSRYKVTVDVSPQKFRVSASISMKSNNHVGSSWSSGFKFENEDIHSGATVSAMPGDYVTAGGWAQENDSNPDYDSFYDTVELTEEVCKNGFTIEGDIRVRENGGRYRGSIAEWYVKMTFTPIN